MNTIPISRSLRGLMIFLVFVLSLVLAIQLQAQDAAMQSRLKEMDGYVEKLLTDWNAPGVGVGIVMNDKLVFAKGYGYRDYDKKLPFTPNTLFPIASNTKLFTAVAAGLLVKEGKLDWDRPIRESVASIRFPLGNSFTRGKRNRGTPPL